MSCFLQIQMIGLNCWSPAGRTRAVLQALAPAPRAGAFHCLVRVTAQYRNTRSSRLPPPPMGNRKGMPTAIPQMDRNLLVEVYKSGQAPGSRGANE